MYYVPNIWFLRLTIINILAVVFHIYLYIWNKIFQKYKYSVDNLEKF